MNRLCSLPVVVCALCLFVACGGDDDDNNNTGAAGSAGGAPAAGAALAASGGSGGSVSSGTGTEGVLCENNGNCESGLRCVVGGTFETERGKVGIKVCARGCAGATDCKEGELCRTLTGDPAASLCLSMVDTPFEPCGASDTSLCSDNFECIPVETADEDRILGACVQLCPLPGATLSGPPCPSDLSCLPALGDPEIGACARPAARGEACGVEVGAVCSEDDFCIYDGANAHCYQDCSMMQMCAAGQACTGLPDGDSFCKPM